MEENKKYITVKNGIDFRKIAKIMSRHKFKMNHATARNQLISAMNSLLEKTAENIGVKVSREKLEELIKDQIVHDSLSDVLCVAYKDYLKDSKNGE
jgi:cytidylate kinase